MEHAISSDIALSEAQLVRPLDADVAGEPDAVLETFTHDNILPTSGPQAVVPEDRGRPVTKPVGQFRRASVEAARILAHKVSAASENPRDHWRAFVGEFLGTSVFIYLGLALSATDAAGSVLSSAMVAGGALTALIFSLGHVSGGHLNPAVTLAIVLVRALPAGIGALYVVSQLLGSLVAAAFFSITATSRKQAITDSTFGLDPSVPIGIAFLVQLIVSGFLCWVVLATGVDSRGGEPRNFLAALPIGIAVAVGVVVAAPLIGASMNPAGSFGVILIYSLWKYSYVYLAGPLVASAIIAIFYKFVFMTQGSGLSALHLIRGITGSSARGSTSAAPFV